jgi:hypothetical protein
MEKHSRESSFWCSVFKRSDTQKCHWKTRFSLKLDIEHFHNKWSKVSFFDSPVLVAVTPEFIRDSCMVKERN